MSSHQPIPEDDADQDAWLEALLQDPANGNNPLLPALQLLCRRELEHKKRLTRLLRISDGYYSLAKAESKSLLERCDRHIRRLEKISRISDRYQRSLLDLNEHLRQAALRDPLTGLANRRMMTDRIAEEQERARRRHTDFTLAMLDVDYFKKINDTHGHEMGDRALCSIAEAINSNLRNYDLGARWGGEEFMILLPHTSLKEAGDICTRMQRALAGIKLEQTGQPLNITASIGLTAYRGREEYTQTIGRADQALLRAKRRGRNRIETA
ncbi:biofilm regulation diguanylate cyclase SiaD [Zobellella maritima]|uniref:biofilm regulation diguanylate cyclase SiaD n=1 Tax=Zobellella maritima TaxID=2059725 RepID=UPI000E30310B|nr:biofilm regulation diguanylate cyclase SiaD [Zobellella maritima]